MEKDFFCTSTCAFLDLEKKPGAQGLALGTSLSIKLFLLNNLNFAMLLKPEVKPQLQTLKNQDKPN